MTIPQGIAEIVMETPCYTCHRLARYTAHHRASEELLERLAAPLRHLDVHEIVWGLEELHQQVPVGRCACGEPGQETTSAEFSALATREDLNQVAPDLSFEICSLSLDGRRLWDWDGEQFSNLLSETIEPPDPTPEKFRVEAEARIKTLEECSTISDTALNSLGPGQQSQYIRTKAQLFSQIGADAYRRQDALGEPNGSLSAGDLAAVTTGMEQLAEGRGFSPDHPLEGVCVSASHALTRTLHFRVMAQYARPFVDGFMDVLRCQHIMNPQQQVTIFNRVPTGAGRMLSPEDGV